VRRRAIEILRCPLTGAPLRLEAFETDGDTVESGVLRGPVCDYPIVGGIAVLRGGDDDVVAHLRSGDHAGATALAIARDLPLSRLDDLLPVLSGFRPTRASGQRLADRLRQTAERRAASALQAAAAGDPDPVLRLAMVDNRRPNPEGYRYFRNRLGLPRHLVALSCLAALRPSAAPIVEVGCGAGHLTWQLAALMDPRPVIGVERELYLLWVAKHTMAPEADFVCGDARSLPLATGSCAAAVAVDVLSFVSEKANATRELERVLAPGGGLVLTSLINARAEHEFRGEPLAPDEWAALVEHHEHRAYSDEQLLSHYLEGGGVPAEHDPIDASAKTLTILAGEAAMAGIGQPPDGWPHAIGTLGPHPLLAVAHVSDGQVELRPRFPSAGFQRDNIGLRHYLPETLRVDASVLDDARAGRRSAEVDQLVAEVALIGYPGGYRPDPWTAAGL
jgi:SAM-dependent methyltransferase/uncharacterized protein YbaR (Trm112 family)